MSPRPPSQVTRSRARREEVWEPVPPAPRVPDPLVPARVRDDGAGDFGATHTHTHAHTRTHARAREPRALRARGAPLGGRPGRGRRLTARAVAGPQAPSTEALQHMHSFLQRERKNLHGEARARGRPAPRPPRLLQRAGDGLRGAQGSRAHGTVPGAAPLVRRAGAPPGAALPGAPGLGHASAGSARHFGTFGRAAPLRRTEENVTAGRASFGS